MDSLRNTYLEEDEDEEEEEDLFTATTTTTTASTSTNGGSGEPLLPVEVMTETPGTESKSRIKEEDDDEEEEDHLRSEGLSDDEVSSDCDELKSLKSQEIGENAEGLKLKPRRILEVEESEDPPPKKQKPLSSLSANPPSGNSNGALRTAGTAAAVKKAKKKNSNVWTKPSSRKGKKKNKPNNGNNNSSNDHVRADDKVFITPVPRFFDKNDDSEEMEICLSKVYKAEKVELSEDRMCAGSVKGYRMVRTTRGIEEGAWYFEIRVLKLGETGHTRLGWSTEKGDLQAPVGYDGNSYGYRDIDGCKIHKALREKYGNEGYMEGDVIGFYINLPEGSLYVPKLPRLVLYKGQRYVCAPTEKEDPPKIIPGSEISFFKNGVCQGVAFKDLFGGRYYPAASMYTLPSQPNCTVEFNFGPEFRFFPKDFEGRPVPRPMIEVPYRGFESRIENGVPSEKQT